MNSTQIRNSLVIVAVIALVGGVAFFKTIRSEPAQSSPEAISSDASVISPPARTPAKKALPRLVDLGAGKCQACKEMAPILDAVREEFTGRAIVEFIDVWKDPDAADPFDVRIIPTQIFYDRDGKEVWRHEGGLSKAEIVEKLKSLGA